MKERKPDGGLAEWIETLEAMGGEDDGEMLCLLLELRRFREDKPAIIERLEAAEAQVKELTADLDKESEIRHRIHEELNAIKGEQQSVKQLNIAGEHWMDVSPQKYRELSEERATVRTLYTHPAPAVLPPEIGRDDADGYWLYKGRRVSSANAAYYNQALRGAKELGSKTMPVIYLTPEINPLMFNGDVVFGYKKARQEVISSILAAGLEVKS